MTIVLSKALLNPDGSYLCAITRNGVGEVLSVVPGMANAPDNDLVLGMVKTAFVEPSSTERVRALITSAHPHIVFSIEKDRADAMAVISNKIATARTSIQRDPVRYKVAHAALNGDSVAQSKLKTEGDYRAMKWEQIADEIVRDEHDEERRSFALSGLAAASQKDVAAAMTPDAVIEARDAAVSKISNALA